MPRPSLAELRSEGQPQWVLDRINDEHWAGRLYMRKISPWATWVFARLGWSPNAVTITFIACGVTAGILIALGGLVTAAAAAILVQASLLFDCADGELARWSKRTSPTGVFLDRIGHYAVDIALLAGLGIRAQGHLTTYGSYVTAGLAAALLAVLVKAETDIVQVARAIAGLGSVPGDGTLQPRGPGLARARRAVSMLHVHRILQFVELSLLILLASTADAIRGGLLATRFLILACLAIGAFMVIAHLTAIITSRRLA